MDRGGERVYRGGVDLQQLQRYPGLIDADAERIVVHGPSPWPTRVAVAALVVLLGAGLFWLSTSMGHRLRLSDYYPVLAMMALGVVVGLPIYLLAPPRPKRPREAAFELAHRLLHHDGKTLPFEELRAVRACTGSRSSRYSGTHYFGIVELVLREGRALGLAHMPSRALKVAAFTDAVELAECLAAALELRVERHP